MKCDELNAYVAGFDGILHKNQRHGDVYLKNDVDAAIAELKAKLENVQASMYADVVDANMENRRLRRALWIARAEMARTSAWVFWNRKDDYNYNKWKKVEFKCRAKAEELDGKRL